MWGEMVARSSRSWFDNGPYVWGWDISVSVVAARDGADGVASGDEVFGMPRFPESAGAYAEFVSAPAAQLAMKPGAVGHAGAAARPGPPPRAARSRSALSNPGEPGGQSVRRGSAVLASVREVRITSIRPGKRASRSAQRSDSSSVRPDARWLMTPLSRSTRQWWVSVDFVTPSTMAPPGYRQDAEFFGGQQGGSRSGRPLTDSTSPEHTVDEQSPQLTVRFGGGRDDQFPTSPTPFRWVSVRLRHGHPPRPTTRSEPAR